MYSLSCFLQIDDGKDASKLWLLLNSGDIDGSTALLQQQGEAALEGLSILEDVLPLALQSLAESYDRSGIVGDEGKYFRLSRELWRFMTPTEKAIPEMVCTFLYAGLKFDDQPTVRWILPTVATHPAVNLHALIADRNYEYNQLRHSAVHYVARSGSIETYDLLVHACSGHSPLMLEAKLFESQAPNSIASAITKIAATKPGTGDLSAALSSSDQNIDAAGGSMGAGKENAVLSPSSASLSVTGSAGTGGNDTMLASSAVEPPDPPALYAALKAKRFEFVRHVLGQLSSQQIGQLLRITVVYGIIPADDAEAAQILYSICSNPAPDLPIHGQLLPSSVAPDAPNDHTDNEAVLRLLQQTVPQTEVAAPPRDRADTGLSAASFSTRASLVRGRPAAALNHKQVNVSPPSSANNSRRNSHAALVDNGTLVFAFGVGHLAAPEMPLADATHRRLQLGTSGPSSLASASAVHLRGLHMCCFVAESSAEPSLIRSNPGPSLKYAAWLLQTFGDQTLKSIDGVRWTGLTASGGSAAIGSSSTSAANDTDGSIALTGQSPQRPAARQRGASLSQAAAPGLWSDWNPLHSACAAGSDAMVSLLFHVDSALLLAGAKRAQPANTGNIAARRVQSSMHAQNVLFPARVAVESSYWNQSYACVTAVADVLPPAELESHVYAPLRSAQVYFSRQTFIKELCKHTPLSLRAFRQISAPAPAPTASTGTSAQLGLGGVLAVDDEASQQPPDNAQHSSPDSNDEAESLQQRTSIARDRAASNRTAAQAQSNSHGKKDKRRRRRTHASIAAPGSVAGSATAASSTGVITTFASPDRARAGSDDSDTTTDQGSFASEDDRDGFNACHRPQSASASMTGAEYDGRIVAGQRSTTGRGTIAPTSQPRGIKDGAAQAVEATAGGDNEGFQTIPFGGRRAARKRAGTGTSATTAISHNAHAHPRPPHASPGRPAGVGSAGSHTRGLNAATTVAANEYGEGVETHQFSSPSLTASHQHSHLAVNVPQVSRVSSGTRIDQEIPFSAALPSPVAAGGPTIWPGSGSSAHGLYVSLAAFADDERGYRPHLSSVDAGLNGALGLDLDGHAHTHVSSQRPLQISAQQRPNSHPLHQLAPTPGVLDASQRPIAPSLRAAASTPPARTATFSSPASQPGAQALSAPGVIGIGQCGTVVRKGRCGRYACAVKEIDLSIVPVPDWYASLLASLSAGDVPEGLPAGFMQAFGSDATATAAALTASASSNLQRYVSRFYDDARLEFSCGFETGTSQRLYIATEICGASIADVCVPLLTASAAVALCKQAVEAVDALHCVGLVHGAIRPANLLTDARSGTMARVTDPSFVPACLHQVVALLLDAAQRNQPSQSRHLLIQLLGLLKVYSNEQAGLCAPELFVQLQRAKSHAHAALRLSTDDSADAVEALRTCILHTRHVLRTMCTPSVDVYALGCTLKPILQGAQDEHPGGGLSRVVETMTAREPSHRPTSADVLFQLQSMR